MCRRFPSDLQSWFDADAHPDYFQTTSSVVGNEMELTIEPGPGWPGGDNKVFMRLRVERQ